MRPWRLAGSCGMLAKVLFWPAMIGLSMGALGLPRSAAEGWLVDGKLSQQFAYDDNVRLATRDAQEVGISVTSPSIVVSRTAHDLQLTGTGEVRAAHFFGANELDSVDPRASLEGRKMLERGVVALAGAFARQSTLESELGDTGVLSENGRRISYNLQPSFQYSLTRVDTISMSAGYTDVTYKNATLIDYHSYSADVTWSHLLTRRLTFLTSSFATLYRSEDILDTRTQIYGAQTGLTYLPFEHWSGTLTGGLRYVSAKNSAPDLPFFNSADGSSFGFLFNASVSYTAPQFRMDLSAQRSIDPSGFGSTVERDLVEGNIRHQIQEQLWIYLVGYFQRDRRGGGLGGRDRQYYLIEPGLRWELSRNIGVKAAYRYRAQEYESPSRRADSNNVSLTLTYDFDHTAF